MTSRTQKISSAAQSGLQSLLWNSRSRWGKFGVIVLALLVISTIASMIARFAIIDTYRVADVRVAVIAPLTGPNAAQGQAMKEGAELFEATSRSSNEGLVIGVDVFDSESNPDKAQQIAADIAQRDEHVAMLGGWDKLEISRLARSARQNELAYMTIVPRHLGRSTAANVFDLNFSKKDEVRFLANYVRNVQDDKLVSIIRDDAQFAAEADLFKETFERFGVQVRHEWQVSSGQFGGSNRSIAEIAKMIKETPDSGTLYLALDQEQSSLLVKELRGLRAINRIVGTSDLATMHLSYAIIEQYVEF